MSTDERDEAAKPVGVSPAVSSWFFAAVLLLAAFWPDPAIWLNEMTLDLPLAVDGHETFGMEPFQWDVPLWYLFGLVFIGLVVGREKTVKSVAATLIEELRSVPRHVVARVKERGRMILGGVGVAIGVVALVFVLDESIVGWLASIPESTTEPLTRPINRLAGGSAPTLIALFFFASGMGWGSIAIARQGIAVAVVALLASVPMAIAKAVVGRARPEVWEGAFHFFSGGESFPSGHTLSAFVLASIVWLSRVYSLPVRIVAVGLAVSVAVSRVLTFRHWPSDVTASAALAIVLAWIVVPALRRDTREDESNRASEPQP